MSDPTPPVWEQIDYSRDAVLEASAGTGKTYALEHIVLQLVQKGRVENATQILLVTFTEKAAGELRDRVRDILQKNAAMPEDFDLMTIGTIHSFCRQLLSEHAFENGAPMRLEVTTADKALLREAALAVLHSAAFAAAYGAHFPEWVAVMGCKKLDGDQGALISELVKRAPNPAAAPTAPAPCPPSAIVAGLFAAAAAAWRQLPAMPADAGGVIAWLEAASGKAGKINGTDAKGVPNKYLAARKFMDACAAGNDDLWAAFAACWGDWQKAATKDYHLNPRFNGQTERLAQLPMAVPAIKDFIANFQAAMAQADQELTDLKDALLDALAAAVRAEYERRKDEAGVMTFDDMVLRAQKVLVGPDGKPRPEAAPLIAAARQRWRYALIDEFQDTDDRQWDIFRTLFSSDARKDGGAMLVVGDPKQAIYSFRGADVNAYLRAREHIVAANPKALHTLDTTFRCTERMTAVFNCLFSLPQWFPAAPAPGASAQPVPSAQPAPGAGGIAYAPVNWGGKYVADRDLAPLVLLESLSPRDMAAVAAGGTAGKGLGNADRCLPAFARAAAAEIKQLLGKVPGQVKGDDGLTDCAPLAYDDFCFLVRKGSEAAPIKRALAQAGIPYSHYKEAGLYRSADGESARAVFDFLAAPERPGNLQALLLTPFFGVPPQDLAARAAALDQGFWNLVGVWQALAAARDWAGLFASLLHASRVARRQGFDPEHGRRVAALRQIFDDLLFKCPERPRRDVADLSAMLRDWAAEERGDREAGVREKESEAPHVQIMTMHTAKGLEFPVVFLAAGLGPIARKGDPLTPEMVAEEKRLFYVALTRAKFRLYLPGTAAGDGFGLGSAGSAWRLGVVKETAKDEAPPAIDAATGPGFLALAIDRWRAEFKGDPATKEVLRAGKHAAWAVAGLAPGPQTQADGAGERAAGPPPAANAAPRPPAAADDAKGAADRARQLLAGVFRANSYSSLQGSLDRAGVTAGELAQAPGAPEPPGAAAPALAAETGAPATATGPTPAFAEGREADEAEDAAVGDILAAAGGDAALDALAAPAPARPSLLPRGALSGDVFHKIMERLCRNPDDDPARPGFANAADANDAAAQEGLLALVAETRAWFGLANREEGGDSTDLTLARMARNALNAPIDAGGGATFALREVPHADRRAEVRFVAAETLLGSPGGGPAGDGAFNGSIDLVFRHGGRYFLLDWKTNTLPAYDEKTMRALYEGEYRLQAQLYGAVLREWLGAAPAKVIYLFVRAGEGAGPTSPQAHGPGAGALVMDAENPGAAGAAIAGALRLRAEETAKWRGAAAARRRRQQSPGARAEEKEGEDA